MEATVRELAPQETARAFGAMAELRTHLSSPAELSQRVERQRPEGYRLAGVFVPGEDDAVAVAGFRINHNLVSGRFLYVDDLVTRSSHRRQGHAHRLLGWLREEAVRHGCDELHLDSAHHRFAAHRVYLAAGFDIVSHHFAIRSL